jgi:tetratricopeptide (TPR) repeat protein
LVDGKFKYKAFLSYSHADRRWARWLHRALESYRTPKRLIGKQTQMGRVPDRISPVFRDREELASSPDLSARIREALEQSESLIVICSVQAARSRWVNEEVELYKRIGRASHVFAMIVDGDPTVPGSDEDCFPRAIRMRFGADGSVVDDEAEPIAADARKSGDGRDGARLKLIAGLLGVGLNDLRQRELQRRQRHMGLITAGSLGAAVITGYLALTAILARDDANQRRRQAEDLLGFMVGDLRKRLEPIGRLDLLQGVGDQAMTYFATVRPENLSDLELRRQAEIMTQLGEIRVNELQYEDALKSFQEAYERTSALYLNAPDDGERLFARSQAEFWVGFVHWRRGDFAKAREWLVRYRDSGLELTQLDSDRLDWIEEVGYANHNLAVLDQETGNFDAALAGFSQELEILDDLQARESSVDRRFFIADAVSWLGNIALKQGDLHAALAYYERSARESRFVADAEPDNREWLFEWAHSAHRVAELAAITGHSDRALAISEDVFAALDTLVGNDPDNLEWKWSSAKPMLLKGYVLASHGDNSGALDNARLAIGRLDPLAAASPTDRYVRSQLAAAYTLLSSIELGSGSHRQALEAIDQAVANLEALEDLGSITDEDLGNLALAHVTRGNIYQQLDQSGLANESWQTAIAMLEPRSASAESHFLLDPWIRVLAATGREQEAQRLRRALEARGYVPLTPWPY